MLSWKRTKGAVLPISALVHSRLCLGLLVIALWMTTRPYLGIIGDSRFYTVQALNDLLPGRFESDLYFRYGSQDQFTIFSFVYEAAILVLGLPNANLVLTIFGQGLWLSGLLYLAKGLMREEDVALAALATAIALPGGSSFGYGDPLLTPRLFAEALTLWSMGLMVRRHPFQSFCLLTLSMIIHPLMTLPGLAVLFLYESVQNRRWLITGAALVAISLALAICGIQPFVRLLETFDPAWFKVVQVRDYFCLLTEWSAWQWLVTGCTIGLWMCIMTVAEPHERQFLVVVLAVAIGGLAATFVGGDILRNVLVVDVQPWRAIWLAAVTCNLFAAPVFLRFLRNETSCSAHLTFPAALVLLVLGKLIVAVIYLAALPVMLATAADAAWRKALDRPIFSSPGVGGITGMLIVAFGFVAAFAIVRAYAAFLEGQPGAFRQHAYTVLLVVAALCTTMACLLACTNSLRIPWPVTWLAIGLVACAAFRWDQRTSWTKFVGSGASAPASLTRLLPENASVYWEGDVRVPWFVLRYPSYFSCAQGTGVLFSRGTAIDYSRRYKNIGPLQTVDCGTEPYCPSPEEPATLVNREDLLSVCARDAGLDYVVLLHPVDSAPASTWVAPAEFSYTKRIDGEVQAFSTDKFHVYSCAEIRALSMAGG